MGSGPEATVCGLTVSVKAIVGWLDCPKPQRS
jgi:hypothetical protein